MSPRAPRSHTSGEGPKQSRAGPLVGTAQPRTSSGAYPTLPRTRSQRSAESRGRGVKAATGPPSRTCLSHAQPYPCRCACAHRIFPLHWHRRPLILYRSAAAGHPSAAGGPPRLDGLKAVPKAARSRALRRRGCGSASRKRLRMAFSRKAGVEMKPWQLCTQPGGGSPWQLGHPGCISRGTGGRPSRQPGCCGRACIASPPRPGGPSYRLCLRPDACKCPQGGVARTHREAPVGSGKPQTGRPTRVHAANGRQWSAGGMPCFSRGRAVYLHSTTCSSCAAASANRGRRSVCRRSARARGGLEAWGPTGVASGLHGHCSGAQGHVGRGRRSRRGRDRMCCGAVPAVTVGPPTPQGVGPQRRQGSTRP